MRFIRIQFNKTNTQLITQSIFGTIEVLNQIDEVQDHYKILKCFLPNFNEYYAYRYFNPFPYFNCNFRIKGQGKTVKIVPNKDIIVNNIVNITKNDLEAKEIIPNDYIKSFKGNVFYSLFFIYEYKHVLYMITATYDNRIIIISKAKKLENLFNGKPLGKSVFDFQPLSEQGVKYIYYYDKIVGVLYGIGEV